MLRTERGAEFWGSPAAEETEERTEKMANPGSDEKMSRYSEPGADAWNGAPLKPTGYLVLISQIMQGRGSRAGDGCAGIRDLHGTSPWLVRRTHSARG